MPRYFYVARNKDGTKTSGTEEGMTRDEVVSRLQSKGYIVVSISPEVVGKDALAAATLAMALKGKNTFQHNRVTSGDLTLFCRQLATLLGAGVTILKSLQVISQQVASKRLYRVIKDLEKSMEAGLSFHEAMAKYPEIFREIWINLVESGEASGNLAAVLSRLAGYLERDAAFKKKIVSALVYPAILFVAGIAALIFMTVKIVPTFAEIFSSFNIKLPLLTRILVWISSFLRNYFLVIFAIIGATIWMFRKYISTKSGKLNYEKRLLSLPVFGEFFHIFIIERFTSEMATLVESGVPILYSLEIAEHSVDNLVLADIIRTIKESVRAGKPLGQSLERSNFFDPMAVQMINIGEEIGELSNMFKRLNTFYQEYLDTFLNRFTAMFEPFMLVFIGAVIGIMVVGMFLPIFELSQIGSK